MKKIFVVSVLLLLFAGCAGKKDTILAKPENPQPVKVVKEEPAAGTQGSEGDLDSRIVELDKAIELNPENVKAYQNHGAA